MIDNVPYRYAHDFSGNSFLCMIDTTYDQEFIIETLPNHLMADGKDNTGDHRYVTIVNCMDSACESVLDLVEMLYSDTEDEAATNHAVMFKKWNELGVSA